MMKMSNLVFVTSLLILQLATRVTPILVTPQTDSAWATGWMRDPKTGRFFVVSTVFKDGNSDVVISGNDDTDCLVFMGDGSGTWVRNLFENPQMCVGGGLVLNHGVNNRAVVVGTSDTQASLQNLENIRETPHFGDVWNLPFQTMPVALEAADALNVFVGLHSTQGQVYTRKDRTDVTTNNNLQGLFEYWQQITQPLSLTTSSQDLQILKMDTVSGTVKFHIDLLVQDGSATISALRYTQTWLLVVGSTNGDGDAFGQGNQGSDDWDGYIAFIDPTTGTLASDSNSAIRFSSQTGKDDVINDICVLGNMAYLVGTTAGLFDGIQARGAFVVKLNLETRQVVWKRQVAGWSTTGTTCVVSPVGIYVGGHTNNKSGTADEQNGENQSSFQDLLISGFTYDGDLLWTQQIDSSIFMGGGRQDQLVHMELNGPGDINLLWNSMDWKGGSCDILIMDISKGTGVNDIGELQGKEDSIEETLGNDLGNSMTPPASTKEGSDGIDKDEVNRNFIISVAVVVPLIAGIVIFAWQWSLMGGGQEPVDQTVDHDLVLHQNEPPLQPQNQVV